MTTPWTLTGQLQQADNDWQPILQAEAAQPYFSELAEFVEAEYARETPCYPPKEKIFAAFAATPLSQVRVVILGQDPYHNPGQAQGLSFSAPAEFPLPRALRNIYQEIQSEYGGDIPSSPDLTRWAEQGVLLLNTCLTVRAHQPNSHKNCGWRTFTDHMLEALNQQEQPIVFLLWGKQAQEAGRLITNPNHCILESAHPSPLSARRGFFGCGHFRKANDFLSRQGRGEIRW